MNPDISSFRIYAGCFESRVIIYPTVIEGSDKRRNIWRVIAAGIAADIIVAANSAGAIKIAISGARTSVRSIAVNCFSFFGVGIIETGTVVAALGMAGSALFYKIAVTSANLPIIARICSAIGGISFLGIGSVETRVAGTSFIVADSGFLDIISVTAGIDPVFAIVCSAVGSLSCISCCCRGASVIGTTFICAGLTFFFISRILTTALSPGAAGVVSAVLPNVVGSVAASIRPIAVIVVTN